MCTKVGENSCIAGESNIKLLKCLDIISSPNISPDAVTPDQNTPSTSPAAAVSDADCPNELSDIESDSDMDSWIYRVTGLQK